MDDINTIEDINTMNDIIYSDTSSISTITDGGTNTEFEDTIELIRIFSDLVMQEEKEPFINTISDDDMIDITCTVYELVDDYITVNIIYFHEPTFHTKMEHEITEYIFENWFSAGLCEDNENDDDNSENDFKDVSKLIMNIINDYFELSRQWSSNIPKRFDTHYKTNINIKSTINIIDTIRAIPQPEQRTPEWYKFRYNLLTASNLGKVFGSEAQRNSLIYEKCSPLKEADSSYTYVNTQSPLHWGQKYEPVSVMLYEKRYNTKVEDFGCIQHNDYKFIGASPDGINVDQTSDRFGRMLEIKNIVNREIDGNPSKQYWIQMQIQLEACNLDYCDFLETRIKEFDTEEEFYESTKEKGVMLHFIERIRIASTEQSNPIDDENNVQYSGAPKYVYMPLDIPLDKVSIDNWIETTRETMRSSWSLYSPLFWYVDEFSCVLVQRNKQWFNTAIPEIQLTWETILKERVTGYEHRASKKRTLKIPGLEITQNEGQDSRTIHNLPSTNGICLVRLDHDDTTHENV